MQQIIRQHCDSVVERETRVIQGTNVNRVNVLVWYN